MAFAQEAQAGQRVRSGGAKASLKTLRTPDRTSLRAAELGGHHPRPKERGWWVVLALLQVSSHAGFKVGFCISNR